MPSIRILQFGGIRPAVEPRLLPLRNAQEAHNTELRRGDLCAYEVPVRVSTCGGPEIYAAPMFSTAPRVLCEDGCMVGMYRACLGTREVGVFYPDDREPIAISNAARRPLLPTAPTVAPALTFISDGPEFEYSGPDARFYLYTWVNQDGVESRPSPPSRVITVRDGAVVDVLMQPPPLDTSFVRIYRNDSPLGAPTDKEGEVRSTPQLVAEVEPTALFRDDFRLAEMEQGGLTTLDNCDPPIMRCVAETEAGYLVGFDGHELYFSEVGEPHNWPERYHFTLTHEIVGIAVRQNTVYVGTTGNPYRVSIAQPSGDQEHMQSEVFRYDANLPLYHQHAITASDNGGAYSSKGGIVFLDQNVARLATRDRVDEDVWDDEVAPTMLVWQNGRLFGYGGPIGGFIMGWQGADNLDIGDLVTIGWEPGTIHAGYDGRVYYTEDGDTWVWDEGDDPLPYRWVSRIYRAQGWMKWAAAKVVGEQSPTNPVTFRLFSEKGLYWAQPVVNNEPFRLPCGPRGIDWWIEIEGTACVREVHVATSKQELTETGATDG